MQRPKEFDGKKLESTAKDGFDLGDDDDENMLEELKAEFKPLMKLMKEEVGDARQQDIQRILEDFKGVKNIPGIKSATRRVLITKIKNEKGETITSRKGIANVFGEFCNKLFDDNEKEESEQEIGENENESSTDVHNNNTNEMTKIPEITTEEWRTAINKLKKGKSPRTTHLAPRTTHHAPRTTHHAPRTTHNAQRTTHNAQHTTRNTQLAIRSDFVHGFRVQSLTRPVPYDD